MKPGFHELADQDECGPTRRDSSTVEIKNGGPLRCTGGPNPAADREVGSLSDTTAGVPPHAPAPTTTNPDNEQNR